MAEAAVGLLLDEAESRLLVQVPGGVEPLVGPEGDLPVSGVPGVTDALAHQPPSDAEAASRGLDEQQPELGGSCAAWRMASPSRARRRGAASPSPTTGGRFVGDTASDAGAEVLAVYDAPRGSGGSPYAKWGDWFAWVCVSGTLIFLGAGWSWNVTVP